MKKEIASDEEQLELSSTPQVKCEKQEEIELPPSPPLVVDHQKLKYLLYHTVQVTTCAVVKRFLALDQWKMDTYEDRDSFCSGSPRHVGALPGLSALLALAVQSSK